MSKARILLVEDDASSREATKSFLEEEGFEVLPAEDGAEALQRFQEGVAVVVTDLKMQYIDGMELLRTVRRRAPYVPVIMVTGHGSEEAAVQALKEGAFHYLTKPTNPDYLLHLVQQAVERHSLAAQIAALREQLNRRPGFHGLVGDSEPMRQVFEKIRIAADIRTTVLIEGETGTGKELVARALHLAGPRRDRPFIAVNCAAIPVTLMESELFGHLKGAFTGAVDKRVGKFVAADGGTLLIDEIGEMPIELQSKLLRAVETQRVNPLGSNEEIESDVRILASTHRDLQQMVSEGTFREDLYYRINVLKIALPPLRERREDIPLLAKAILEEIAAQNQRPVCDITPEALAQLQAYDWPGNVRQLRNVLERMAVWSSREVIDLPDVPEPIRKMEPVTSIQTLLASGKSLAEIEREVIQQTLARTGGNRQEASRVLGISTRTLQRRIKDYGLPG
jgi:two-component system, NtrC family, response regulator AtoC